MEYSKYIELGFERHNTKDPVEFQRYGYHGYFLTKEISDIISLVAYFNELDKPEMNIKKLNSDCIHRVNITPEIVVDLCSEKSYTVDKNSIFTAC